MSIDVTPHLNFRGDARRALERYQAAFGGDLVAITYAEMGRVDDPSDADLVVWGQVTAPDGFRVMAFDVPAARAFDRGRESFFVSVRGTEVEEVQALWDALVVGSTVVDPIQPSQWSPLYGMLTDEFGVTWVLDVVAPYAG